MSVLQGIEPAEVFCYFEELSKIPHISYKEQAISDYCVEFAKNHNLEHRQDDMGNVIIFADATEGYEDQDTIMIQGHLDMVGEKIDSCNIDMEKEGVQIQVEGDLVTAKGTTLGGDNGIAVAYALAILSSDSIPHPRLEVVLTVSEEVGLLGATGIDLSECKATKMLNIDSEVEGILTVGCAGGVRTISHVPVNRVRSKGNLCTITLDGMQGGHSGIEINKGRANANSLMGRFLMILKDSVDFGLVEMFGGTKENIIPNKSQAKILVDNTMSIQIAIDEFMEQMKAEYGTADPDINVNFEIGKVEETEVIDKLSLKKVLTSVNLMPNGVQVMSADLPGLVETSLNLGVMNLEKDELILRTSIRSSIASAKNLLVKKIKMLIKTLGGKVELAGEYPAWPYKRDSKLRDLCIDVYEKQYGTRPAVEILHAGLECGIFSDKMPGMDCISFGPNLYNVHTPKESMSISSVARVWDYLKAILATKK